MATSQPGLCIVFLYTFPVTVSIFLSHMMYRKIHSNIIHKTISIVLIISFCVLNFIFPTCRSNFAKAASTAQKAKQPCDGRLWRVPGRVRTPCPCW